MFLNKRTKKDIFFQFTVFACVALGSLMWAGCRHSSDAPKPRIDGLQFVNPKIEMKIGERQAVKINIKPDEARKHYTVEYTASVDGYVAISETSNDGCVLTAEGGGTVVVIAQADGRTAYLEVTVTGEVFSQEPYINLSQQVIEVQEGARKSVQVSLYNGSAVDQQQFKWEVETGKDNISINPTGNVVVVQGEKRGAQKIIVSHEKSEYTAEILVFVLGVDEQVRYITSGQNVITMTAGGPSHELTATLVGGSATDISGFTFSIMEENPCIEILPSNNSCSIAAKRKGTAVIKIEHPLAEYPLEVRVIVLLGEESYFELDKTFMMLDVNKGDFINASMGGYYLENWNADYHYTIKGGADCVEATQTNYSFYILAKNPGSCVVEITNAHMEYGRECLIVVRDPAVIPPDEFYITTSQNVIQLEVGQSIATQLSIQLINGVEADKNSFSWTVEDGRIITVEALDLPAGTEVNYLTRSMSRRNRATAEIKSVANTLALITPKKAGSTKIIISHPKSKSEATVICKVYPKGTFGGLLYVLVNENEAEGGLIKIDTTKKLIENDERTGVKKVKLKLAVGGDPANIGKLNWDIKQCAGTSDVVASLYEDLSGLENEIHGIRKGVNKLTVSNEDTLKYPFEATVMVGTTQELAEMAVLYVDQVYQTVAVGQSVSVPILNSNMNNGQPNGLSEDGSYYVEGYDKKVVVATMIKNRLLLQGLQDGQTTVTVKNRTSTEIIPVDVKVTVVPGFTTIDKPYMITSSVNFVGMNVNTSKEFSVKLSGDTMDSSAVEKDRVRWSSANSTVVKVTNIDERTGNAGETGILQGVSVGQANITVTHDRSVNEKVIVAYVVPEGVDPETAVVLGIAQDHWLLKPDDEVMMQLLTNADESPVRNINDIKWLDKNLNDYKTSGSDSVIDVDYNGDRAMVRAKAQGSTVVTVTHPKKVIDLKIYISVSNTPALSKNITLPAIVELIIGENKVLTAVAEGLSDAELNGIEWALDDPSVVSLSGDQPIGNDGKIKGGKLFIKGKARGQAWLTASQGDLGYFKKILVVCARTYDELANTFVMASEESYFRMKKGDVRAVPLVYGSAGFPESEKLRITWEDLDRNNVVKIHPETLPQGEFAEVEAAGYGIARVKVNHDLIFKPVELTFEVSPELTIDKGYQFIYNGMLGLVVWKGADGAPGQYVEPYTKDAVLSISPAGLSYNGIEWTDEEKPDKGIVSVTPGGTGNAYQMTGRKKGQTYIKFHHKSGQIPDDARILVYTADTVEELAAMFPIGVGKPNYLLTIGDPAELVKISVPSQSMAGLSNAEYKAKLDKIGWDFGSAGANIINYTINIDNNDLTKYKQEITIQGRNPGNCYFDVKYEGKVIERIYISVKAKLEAEMNRRIVTENIIGLSPDASGRMTSVGCNLTQDEKTELQWGPLDDPVVSVRVDGNDRTKCYLTALRPGETEIVVSFRNIERYIKVYVDADVDHYKAVNLDNRYYQIRKNDTLPLSAFHAALPCSGDDQWQFYPVSNPFDNKVVELKPNGKDKVNVTGINEGIATVVLYNSECKTDVTFMVEVNNTAPLVETSANDGYLTAFKTVYAIDPSKTMDVTRVSVSGVRLSDAELAKVEWTVVSEEINGVKHIIENEPSYKPALLTFNNKRGTFVDLMPNNKTGTAVIRASHAQSVNDIDITVICDAAAALAQQAPHITADRETVKLQLNEEAEILVSIADLGEVYDIAQFRAESDNTQKVTVETVGNHIKVKGVNFGQALVTVTHPKLPGFAKKIVVIVMSGDTSVVYLTTKQNFVVLEKGGYQAVEVELVGFTDVNSRNYIWNTDDHDIITINDSGRSAVITAKNVAKTAKITVQHIACLEYPLAIYVRVTEKNTSNPVYITTPNNIVSIKEGAGIQVKANLVNGGGHELSQFTWSTNDRHLIELNYSGDTAMVKGLQPGTARVQIWHPSSLNSITMLVVVEPLTPNNGIYIATDSQLIEMTTNESQRQVKVRLIGGEPEDVYAFQWEISSYMSELKQGNGQSYQPVTLLSNADVCYIQPVMPQKYEGEAIITVSHPKTSYKLDIKVIIADATDIQFAQSYITINQYEQVSVGLTAPSNGRMSVVIDKPNVVDANVTEKLCIVEGLQEGTTIVRVSNLSGTKSDELVVRVNKVDLTNYAFINVFPGTVFNPNVGEQIDNIYVQINGAENDSDEQQLLRMLECNIVNPTVVTGTPIVYIEQLPSTYDKPTGKPHQWSLHFIMRKAGLVEITFRVKENGLDETEIKLLEKKYPLFKNSKKTVYFKISEGDNVYSVDRQFIDTYEGNYGEMVLATIKNGPDLKASQIEWNLQKDADGNEVDCVEISDTYYNDSLFISRIFINAKKAGTAVIEVKFGAVIKYVTVVVNPVKYVHASKTNVSVQPGTYEDLIVTCNPYEQPLTWHNVNGNVSEIKWKPYNSAGEPSNTGMRMSGGDEEGYLVRIIGSDFEGTDVVTFEMSSDIEKRKTQVSVQNINNFYARWLEKNSLRFTPATPEGDTLTRIYYELNPSVVDGKETYLQCVNQTELMYNFNVVTGKAANGKYYVQLNHPTGIPYYPTAIKTGTSGIRFKVVNGNTSEEVKLDVFIYFDRIDVSWGQGTQTQTPAKFDAALTSIILPYNKLVQINLTALGESAEIKQKQLKLKEHTPVNLKLETQFAGQIINVNCSNQDDQKYFTVKRAAMIPGFDETYPGTVQQAVYYLGTLEVKYEYINGSITPLPCSKVFILWAAIY